MTTQEFNIIVTTIGASITAFLVCGLIDIYKYKLKDWISNNKKHAVRL